MKYNDGKQKISLVLQGKYTKINSLNNELKFNLKVKSLDRSVKYLNVWSLIFCRFSS